jgi:hypothetical protein
MAAFAPPSRNALAGTVLPLRPRGITMPALPGCAGPCPHCTTARPMAWSRARQERPPGGGARQALHSQVVEGSSGWWEASEPAYGQKIETCRFTGRCMLLIAPSLACPAARSMCTLTRLPVAKAGKGRHWCTFLMRLHQALLPEQSDGVRRELRIVCHQGQTLPVGLGDEKAVEGIPVVQGQAIQGVDML